jgi:hypothetical protein
VVELEDIMMRSAVFLPAFALCGLVAATAVAPGARLRGASQVPVQHAASASIDDQVDVGLTVYNSRIALVRDVRQVTLPAGESPLSFADIASALNPVTVHVRSLTDPARLAVVEQNYEYDLLEPQKLLQKYVGREITLVPNRLQNGTTVTEEVRATLLAYNNGPVWKIGNEIVTGMPTDHFRFPELPANLYSRPTLVWRLDNRGTERQRLEVSYLTGGLSWSADYVLTVGRDDREAALDGWVTLTNASGASYRRATLQLVAGDLHRVAERAEVDEMRVAKAMAAAESPASFAREAFNEYHLYSLNRRTSIEEKQTKQLALLSAPAIPVEKRFIAEGQRFYYHNAQHPGSPLKDAVKVYYTFRNEEPSGLGMPLPAGVVRVYQADSKGSLHFVGEDRIDHTPKDETLNLQVGSAFDIVCERKQTDYRHLSDTVWELAYEITLRNHKTTPIRVEVNEPIGGDWEMISASHRWVKTEAWAARFDVPVTAEGSATLKYRVRIR